MTLHILLWLIALYIIHIAINISHYTIHGVLVCKISRETENSFLFHPSHISIILIGKLSSSPISPKCCLITFYLCKNWVIYLAACRKISRRLCLLCWTNKLTTKVGLIDGHSDWLCWLQQSQPDSWLTIYNEICDWCFLNKQQMGFKWKIHKWRHSSESKEINLM